MLSILEIYEIHIFANFCDINIYDLLYRHGQGRVITIIHATQGFQDSTNMEPFWASDDATECTQFSLRCIIWCSECFWLLEDYLYSMEMNIPEVKIFSNQPLSILYKFHLIYPDVSEDIYIWFCGYFIVFTWWYRLELRKYHSKYQTILEESEILKTQ